MLPTTFLLVSWVIVGCSAAPPESSKATSPSARDSASPKAVSDTPSNVSIVVTGSVDVTLSDPAGRRDVWKDGEQVSSIPGCQRYPDIAVHDAEDETGEETAAMRFELGRWLPGEYVVVVKPQEESYVSIQVIWDRGEKDACTRGDADTLKRGVFHGWRVAWRADPARDTCVVNLRRCRPKPARSGFDSCLVSPDR